MADQASSASDEFRSILKRIMASFGVAGALAVP